MVSRPVIPGVPSMGSSRGRYTYFLPACPPVAQVEATPKPTSMAYSLSEEGPEFIAGGRPLARGYHEEVTAISARRWSPTSHLPNPPHFFENVTVRIRRSAGPSHPLPGGRTPGFRGSRRTGGLGGAVLGGEAVEHAKAITIEMAKANPRRLSGPGLFLALSRTCAMVLFSTTMIGLSPRKLSKIC